MVFTARLLPHESPELSELKKWQEAIWEELKKLICIVLSNYN